MTTPAWQAGTLYSPGAVVQRNSAPPVIAQPPVNAAFDDGDTGWTKESPWTIGAYDNTFVGANSARCNGVRGSFRIYNATAVPVAPGMSITASCMIRRADGNVKGQVQLEWLDNLSASIAIIDGTLIDYSEDKWKTSSVTAVAPAGAAYVRIGAKAILNRTDVNLHADAFQWNYAYSPPIDSLIFRAVQATAGYSGGTEPVWPDTLGEQVVDNEVTWEAIDSSTVTWEASPILVSGPEEPIFPTAVGDTVSDNTIVWTAVSRRVEDEKCPNQPIVVMAASKVFCGDGDLVSFCATVNPLDWSSQDDAGYLPFGLQAYGSLGDVAAMGLYRGNLLPFNAAAFQMWQVDPDPQAMALLDTAPIGCRHPRTLQAFQNDLIFLSPAGVRNISIAGASTNLQAGGVGEPVDSIVKERVAAGEYEPHSLFIPEFGQYWLVFGAEILVMSVLGVKKASWSRYTFPEPIDNLALLDGVVYLRMESGAILRFDDELTADDVYCQPDAVVLSGDADGYYYTVSLSWTVPTDEIGGYTILRAVDGGLFADLATVDSSTIAYIDADVLPGHSYSYLVIANPVDGLPGWIDSPASNTYSAAFAAEDSEEPPVVEDGGAADEAQCFTLYTASADLTRVPASGATLDDELQFTTEAGKTYWMYGRLRFRQANSAQLPGAEVGFAHAGDTVAFAAPLAAGLDFYPPSADLSANWIPMDLSTFAAEALIARDCSNTTDVWEVAFECTLKVGATGGSFGIRWGAYNAGFGSTTRLEGSYLTAIEVVDG